MLLARAIGVEDSSESKGEEYILQGVSMLDELEIRAYWAQGYLFMGELHAVRGQREKALENLKKVEGLIRGMGTHY